MKKVLTLFMALVMIFSLAACGGKEVTEKSKDPVDTENTAKEDTKDTTEKEDTEDTTEKEETSGEYVFTEPVTIKFANYAILEAGYDQFWNDVKTGFEAKYDNIKIEYLSAEYGQMLTQVVTWAGGGEVVDLVFGESSWAPTLADAGIIIPVTDAFPEDYLSQIYPSILESTSVAGEPYGIPMYASPFIMYYNKDLFEQAGLDPNTPPTTVAQMMEIAPKLAALKTADGNQVYPFGMTTASVAVSGSCLTSLVYGFGGSVLDAEGNLDIDNDGFKQAFEFVQELNTKGYNPQVSKLKDLRNLFALGQVAMYYDQSWGFNGVRSINPDAINFTASAAPLSGGAGTGESLIQAHTFMMANNGEAQVEATKLLIDYIISEEVLAPYLENIAPGYPVIMAMSEIPSIVDSPVLKGAVEALQTAKGITFIPAINDLNIELTALAQAVTVDNKNVDEAISNFKTAAEGILNN